MYIHHNRVSSGRRGGHHYYRIFLPHIHTVGVNIKFPYRTVYRQYLTLLLHAIRIYGGVKFQVDFSSLFIPLLFFPPVSYSAVPLQSIDCFCSSHRLIVSLPARFALVVDGIVSALIVTSSASVRRLFMLFYSPVPLQSIDCFGSSRRLIASLLASFALVRRLFLLF